ncbi:MAG: site-2 protease family protein [Candidatus Diapherotrites archaeon]|nr:site-2 protease family protein [Candidatus Diapherotrites archaeon]
MAWLEIAFYIILFLAAGFSFAYFLKRQFKAQVFFNIFSIVKTKKPIPIFEKFAKFNKFWTAFARFALILGFGSIAVDYLFGRKLSKAKRILLFAVSFVVLYTILFYLLSGLLTPAASSNSIILFSSFALFGCAGLSIVLLAVNAITIIENFFTGAKSIPGVAPLIPGLTIPNVPFTVPLHGWLSLLIILVVHEASHGILARMHKIKVKSTGLLLFGFLPIGAFVEPDEKQFNKEPDSKRLDVLAAGSMANFALSAIVFGIYLLLLASLIAPFASQSVVVSSLEEFSIINGVKEKNPAFGTIFAGDIILSVNGQKISTKKDLQSIVKQSNVLQFELKDVNGIVRSETIEKNKAGVIGIVYDQQIDESKINPLSLLLVEFFYWLFLLNLFVAISNFMPLVPFDGGQIVKLLFLPYVGFLGFNRKESEKFISRVFIWIMGILILINVLPLFQF